MKDLGGQCRARRRGGGPARVSHVTRSWEDGEVRCQSFLEAKPWEAAKVLASSVLRGDDSRALDAPVLQWKNSSVSS